MNSLSVLIEASSFVSPFAFFDLLLPCWSCVKQVCCRRGQQFFLLCQDFCPFLRETRQNVSCSRVCCELNFRGKPRWHPKKGYTAKSALLWQFHAPKSPKISASKSQDAPNMRFLCLWKENQLFLLKGLGAALCDWRSTRGWLFHVEPANPWAKKGLNEWRETRNRQSCVQTDCLWEAYFWFQMSI